MHFLRLYNLPIMWSGKEVLKEYEKSLNEIIVGSFSKIDQSYFYQLMTHGIS